MSDEPLTKKDLQEELRTFGHGVSQRIDGLSDRIDGLSGQIHAVRENIPIQLGDFAEQVILPAVERIIDDKLAAQKHELMDHVERRLEKTSDDIIKQVDSKIEKATGEIVATIKGDRDRDRTFKSKVVEIFRGQQPARAEEVLVLEESMP